jgi:putative membrane-bound dehydrogenase-like protein
MRAIVRLMTFLAVCSVSLSVQAQESLPSKKVRFPSARESAARMTVPEGFEVKVFAAEPDVVNPIGIDFDHKGRAYVLECLQYPRKAPIGSKGADRIRVYEDTKGTGTADKVTTFAEGLNLATGIAVGYGGVFVGEAPYLLFLEDTKGTGKADKRTVLLDGFGYQDTHETLNSFIWGPDGWLYGCHGVFTHSRVGKPGTPDKDRVPINAGIWRYHPKTQKFEVFAEGTSNPWGFDYDENGSGFLTACVIPHLFHIVPGGRYIRQAGQNFNPYNYGQIREICDHVHYFGGSSHVGNIDPRRLAVGGGHAHSGCLIYQGGAYPDKWDGRVFMMNLHGARINTDILKRKGSTYSGMHGEDFLIANDPNFRAIQLRTGPDGSIYMTDWYDPQICHNPDPNIWDRDTGRIYKVVYKASGEERQLPGDLTLLSSDHIVDLLKDKNSWWWRQGLLILQERADPRVVRGDDFRLAPNLKEMARRDEDHRYSLRALWALNNIGAFDEEFGRELLGHGNSWVRAWAVRLLGQLDTRLSDATWKELVRLAERDGSLDVLLQLALSCQRWRGNRDTRDLLQALMLRDWVKDDPVIPLMIWVAYEPYVVDKRREILRWLAKQASMHDPDHELIREYVWPRALRRLVSTGDQKHLNDALAAIEKEPESTSPYRPGLLGVLEGLKGRRLEPPPAWRGLRQQIASMAPPMCGQEEAVRLGLHFGDNYSIRKTEEELLIGGLPLGERIAALQGLALARSQSSIEPLLQLACAEVRVVGWGDQTLEIRREALRALAAFDSDKIGTRILSKWSKLPPTLRTEVVGMLCGRKIWASQLLDALKKGTITKQDLSENDVRRVLAHNDAGLTKKVESIWGKLREQTPAKVEEQLVKFRRQFADMPGDRKFGQAVFEKNCMVCHKLKGQGNEVGPDLTGANRRDIEYLLVNIIDPNRVVGKDYYTATVVDKSGRSISGLLAEDAPERVVLKGENAKLTVIPRTDIEAFQLEERSLMPEGLPEKMNEKDFRDLIAYLMEDQYLTRGLIAGPFKMALDGKGPIEEAADPLKTEGVKWKSFEVGLSGMIDMEKLKVLAPPTDSTAYVLFDVLSPRAMKTALELAVKEDVKVWVNGKEVHRKTWSVEPHRVNVELKEGTNRLMFKVHNIYGPSWMWARLIDPEWVLEVKARNAP